MSFPRWRIIATCIIGLAITFSIFIGETKLYYYSNLKSNLLFSNTSYKFGSQNTMYTTLKSDQNYSNLFCEKVWNDVLTLRRQHLNSELNPNNFVINEFLETVSENDAICDLKNNTSDSPRLLLVLVSSSRTSFLERKIIRETWASIKYYKGGWRVRTVFLLGQSDYCLKGKWDKENKIEYNEKWNQTVKEDQKVHEENQKYGDLIIGSFTDSYRNNTYRHLMGYKFVVERCPKAEFIVKTDDDVFVNIPRILDKRSEETRNGNKAKNDMYCKAMEKRKPVRCKKCDKGKWFVTKDEWPDEKYPSFCLGAFFGISREWVEKLYAVKNMGGFFWIDDPFISGKLREIAEKEFGVKAKWADVTGDIWWAVKKGTCKNVKKYNVRKKLKMLPMFAHLKRDKNFGKLMKCLFDILMAKNLPFSF